MNNEKAKVVKSLEVTLVLNEDQARCLKKVLAAQSTLENAWGQFNRQTFKELIIMMDVKELE
jgi:hypothetical protein